MNARSPIKKKFCCCFAQEPKVNKKLKQPPLIKEATNLYAHSCPKCKWKIATVEKYAQRKGEKQNERNKPNSDAKITNVSAVQKTRNIQPKRNPTKISERRSYTRSSTKEASKLKEQTREVPFVQPTQRRDRSPTGLKGKAESSFPPRVTKKPQIRKTENRRTRSLDANETRIARLKQNISGMKTSTSTENSAKKALMGRLTRKFTRKKPITSKIKINANKAPMGRPTRKLTGTMKPPATSKLTGTRKTKIKPRNGMGRKPRIMHSSNRGTNPVTGSLVEHKLGDKNYKSQPTQQPSQCYTRFYESSGYDRDESFLMDEDCWRKSTSDCSLTPVRSYWSSTSHDSLSSLTTGTEGYYCPRRSLSWFEDSYSNANSRYSEITSPSRSRWSTSARYSNDDSYSRPLYRYSRKRKCENEYNNSRLNYFYD